MLATVFMLGLTATVSNAQLIYATGGHDDPPECDDTPWITLSGSKELHITEISKQLIQMVTAIHQCWWTPILMRMYPMTS